MHDLAHRMVMKRYIHIHIYIAFAGFGVHVCGYSQLMVEFISRVESMVVHTVIIIIIIVEATTTGTTSHKQHTCHCVFFSSYKYMHIAQAHTIRRQRHLRMSASIQ